MNEVIDWGMASRVGVALMRPGPKLSSGERTAAVARLREAAGKAAELVAAASRLPGAEVATHGTTLVVDRAGIVRANAAAMATIFADMGGDDDDDEAPVGGAKAVIAGAKEAGAKVTGVGAGAVLAAVGSSILGQYEPFSGRLLLSAPTIEAVRADLRAVPDDFALWVCLHEQTHRHQFAAAPWLRGYLGDLVRSATQEDEPSAEAEEDESFGDAEVADTTQTVAGLGIVGVVKDSHLRALVAEITALMSLLEGYADMLMDTAGAAVIPSLPSIRAAFDARRRAKKYDPASILRRAVGMGAKIDQYFVGKSFCVAVRDEVGMDGLNAAFTSRQSLPTLDELHDPKAWIARCVVGAPLEYSCAGCDAPDGGEDFEETRRLPVMASPDVEARRPAEAADRPPQAGAS